MKRLGKRICALGVIMLILGSVTSCTSVFSLPHEERYQYINQVLDEVDYKTAGTIVEEQIDDGDGVFEPSYKKVFYQEESAYTILVKRMKKIENYSCSGGKTQFYCTKGQASISLTLTGKDNKETHLGISDSSGGR